MLRLERRMRATVLSFDDDAAAAAAAAWLDASHLWSPHPKGVRVVSHVSCLGEECVLGGFLLKVGRQPSETG